MENPDSPAQAKPTEDGEEGSAAAHAPEAAAQPRQAVPVASRAGEGRPEGRQARPRQGGGADSLQEGNLPGPQRG